MEQWYLYCKKADFKAISEKFSISPMLARILVNRGIKTDDEIEKFLYGSVKDMYDPFLLKGVKEAVPMIAKAVNDHEKIRIIGDYDADGVCSSYILYHYLEFAGAEVSVRLPDRVKDGYGMNEAMAREAYEDNVSLIITCDNGISASGAVLKAKELGMKVIVTDHHAVPEVLPCADVVIDPKQNGCPYPYKEICGAAVAYKLISALSESLKEERDLDSEEILDYLLEFAGIATITDIVPLKDENRIFAKEGIKRLKKTKNPALKALMEIKSVKASELSAYHIGFIIGPAINSAGRLKSADIAFDMLNETNEEKAKEKALYLARLNDERRALTESEAKIGLEIAAQKAKTDKILVITLENAHESVAGIIAGKIKEAFNRPAIVITSSMEGLKGSGRSTDAYNIIEEISKYPGLFSKFGGHAKACGFTLIKSPDELSRLLNENCPLSEEDMAKKVWIDMQLPFEYAGAEFAGELSVLEPFGQDNERPLFAEKNITVENAFIIGKNNNALRLKLKDKKGYAADGIMFADSSELLKITEKIAGDPVISLTYYPEINEFKGKSSVQLKVRSVRSG